MEEEKERKMGGGKCEWRHKKPKGPILRQIPPNKYSSLSCQNQTSWCFFFSPLSVTLLQRNRWLKSTRLLVMPRRGTGRLSSQAKARDRLTLFHFNPIEAKAKPKNAREKGTARKLAGNSGLT